MNKKSMDELVKKASQQLGTSPEEITNQINNGKLDQIMKNMQPQQAKAFQNILNNPQLAKKMMDTPQAKALMEKFFNK